MAGRETALRDKPLEEEEEGKEEEKINAARSDCKGFRPLEYIFDVLPRRAISICF